MYTLTLTQRQIHKSAPSTAKTADMTESIDPEGDDLAEAEA